MSKAFQKTSEEFTYLSTEDELLLASLKKMNAKIVQGRLLICDLPEVDVVKLTTAGTYSVCLNLLLRAKLETLEKKPIYLVFCDKGPGSLTSCPLKNWCWAL